MNWREKQKLRALKREFKDLWLAYRHDTESMPCGRTLTEYLKPELRLQADRINEIAETLKEFDPEFPANWVPL